MSAPAFGDRVKLKVGIPPNEDGGPREPGEIVVVVETLADGDVAVMLSGYDGRLFFGSDEITTDLDWATPRDSAILTAYADVLRLEGVGIQHKRLTRISRLLLTAHAVGLREHEIAEAARIEREKKRAADLAAGAEIEPVGGEFG